MAGRTVAKWVRVYTDGYDFSTYFAESDGLKCEFDALQYQTYADPVTGYLPGQPAITPGNLSGVYDTTATSGPHVNLNGPGVKRTVQVAIGSQAEPALGDPVFGGQFEQLSYNLPLKTGIVPMTIPFSPWAADGATLLYAQPWGQLLNPATARTGANASAGTDNPGGLVSTAFGGYLCYQVLAGNGTATISVDDSADNSAFAALSGATTGSINCAVVSAGVIAIGRTATVRRYLRWQLALGTATTVTFVLSFHRAYW